MSKRVGVSNMTQVENTYDSDTVDAKARKAKVEVETALVLREDRA